MVDYRVGGQKSFFESWLTAAELREVRETLAELPHLSEDRVHLAGETRVSDSRIPTRARGTLMASSLSSFGAVFRHDHFRRQIVHRGRRVNLVASTGISGQ